MIITLVAWLLVPASCDAKDRGCDAITGLQIDEAFTLAAMDTVVQYNQSGRQTKTTPDEVPVKLWSKEIKGLNPINVYFHNNNLAILLSESGCEVNGIYVYIPISSFMPGEELIHLTFAEEPYTSHVVH